MSKKAYYVVIGVLVVAFIASAVYLGNYFLQGKKEADRFDELSAIVAEAVTEGQDGPPDTDEPEWVFEEPDRSLKPLFTGDLLPCYAKLANTNEDMIGWIKIEDTKINYPVMQTPEDNANFYLYRDFDGNDSTRGSIYVREQCDVYGPCDNVTIYGHNMKDGSMFAFLGNYEDKATWEQYPLIFFDTLYEYHVYQIFAVFRTSANPGEGFDYHHMEKAASKEDFENFIDTCKKLSIYDTGITPKYGDKTICLSTCEYTLDNGRFVVAAVRIS